jgi:hypothetical protein
MSAGNISLLNEQRQCPLLVKTSRLSDLRAAKRSSGNRPLVYHGLHKLREIPYSNPNTCNILRQNRNELGPCTRSPVCLTPRGNRAAMQLLTTFRYVMTNANIDVCLHISVIVGSYLQRKKTMLTRNETDIRCRVNGKAAFQSCIVDLAGHFVLLALAVYY